LFYLLFMLLVSVYIYLKKEINNSSIKNTRNTIFYLSSDVERILLQLVKHLEELYQAAETYTTWQQSTAIKSKGICYKAETSPLSLDFINPLRPQWQSGISWL